MDPKIRKIASVIIGVILAIVLIIAGFKIIQTVFIKAADVEPRDVIVSEIGQNTAKVTWSTGEEAQAVIEYGTTPTALNFFSPEAQAVKSHSVDLTLLTPATTYYFQIRIGENKFDNGGVPWTFTTKDVEKTAQPTVPAGGSPTAVPTSINTSPSVTPVQSLEIPNSNTSCTEIDCEKIKAKLGEGCNTQDYFKCVRKLTPTTSTP